MTRGGQRGVGALAGQGLVWPTRIERKRQAGCMAPGYYERPDEEMLALWRTGIQETAKHYRE